MGWITSSSLVLYNFNSNRAELVDGVDYFIVPHEEWKSWSLEFPGTNFSGRGGHRGALILITEAGYCLLVTTFKDKKSWKIVRDMRAAYFLVKLAMVQPAIAATPPPLPLPVVQQADPQIMAVMSGFGNLIADQHNNSQAMIERLFLGLADNTSRLIREQCQGEISDVDH